MGEDTKFQERVQPWMMACFGAEIAADLLERNDRFIEEALEFVQAGDYPKERAHALVEYVYGRPQGEINQEVGGVMVTLAAACLARGVDMHAEAERELARIWTKVEVIRAKQAAKPRGSALPIEAVDPIADLRTTLSRQAELLGRAAKALEPFKQYRDWARRNEWPVAVADDPGTPVMGRVCYEIGNSTEITIGDFDAASSTLNAIRDELKGDANGE